MMPSSSSNHSLLEMTSLISTIQVMRQRETKYRVSNHMPYADCESLDCCDSSSQENIDLECRRKMCQWSYQIIDHCNFQRETVAVAMNMLDRFVDACSLSPISTMTRPTYQLAAITSLYTAIKLCEPQAVSPQSMAALTSGIYSKEHIEAVESEALLPTLQWLLHPPTAISFGQHYVELILQLVQMRLKAWNTMDVDDEKESLDAKKEALMELLQLQLEASIFDYELIQIDPSVVAYAALLNAMECVPNVSSEVQKDLEHLMHNEIFCAQQTELNNQLIQGLRIRLYQTISATNATNEKMICTNDATTAPATATAKSLESTISSSSCPTKINNRISPRSVHIPSSSSSSFAYAQ